MNRLDPVSRSRRLHPSSQPDSRMLFHTEVEQRPSLHLLRLRGELDSAQLDVLTEVLSCERQIAARRGAGLKVDLSEVTFADLGALRAILSVRKACEQHGLNFVVQAGSRAVRRLLDLTGDARTPDQVCTP